MADVDIQHQQQQQQQQQQLQSSQRSSASSGRPYPSRSRQNPQQQLSTIEKSVTHLLVATKQLLETLTQWSRNNATEGEVSDVYVRLGYEFNIACRAFAAINVDTTDLGPVPDLLRAILEDTLSQEPSQASLDKFLPRIRDIIINLLHGLKKKQQRLRQKESGTGALRDGSPAEGSFPRQSSIASNLSRESSVSTQMDDFPARSGSIRPQGSGGDSSSSDLPPRTTSVVGGRQSPGKRHLSPQNSVHQADPRDSGWNDSSSSLTSVGAPPSLGSAPYPEGDIMPSISTTNLDPGEQAPRPPPKQNDALSALQRGGDLERRASRRFSAYQIQKHLGTSMNGIAAIPPAQNSPVPNRGRDVRESLSAVRSRGNTFTRTKSRTQILAAQESSPQRQADVRRISEGVELQDGSAADDEVKPPSAPFASRSDSVDSPTVKTPEDKLGSYPFPDAQSSPEKVSATLNGPLNDVYAPQLPPPSSSSGATKLQRNKSFTPARSASLRAATQTPPPTQFVPESPPQAGKELTLFLQYKSKIKKFVLPDGGDLTVPRLQLAFIEKFAWSTQNHGVDLPEIYIQDPVSGVRHELEDLADIRERSVLVLNVEALDEVKRHIDDGLGGLRRLVEGIRSSVEEQQSAIQRVSDRQQDAAKEIASIAAAPRTFTVAAAPTPTAGGSASSRSKATSTASSAQDKAAQLQEVQSLRRDLAVVRQTYASFVADMNASMSTLRSKASSSLKSAADKATSPALADPNTGRTYVNSGKKQLSDDSERIVNRVDDLQDVVEDLRKDVVIRGVRPLPRQLEAVSKEISVATADLKKLQEFLKREKPIWTKIWEKELQVVCDDRDLLTLQEELAVDLEDDLEKAAATFALVEQATKQQNLQPASETPTTTNGMINSRASPSPSSRSTSRTLAALNTDPSADPQKAKDSVLGEVRALQPNHESRLEAIERAEKARQRELEDRRGGEFERELGNFVDEGRLKKTGGVEEVERIRLLREEKARKEVMERQQQRMRERAEKEAAAAVAAAAGGPSNGVEGTASEVPGNDGAAGNQGPPSLPPLSFSASSALPEAGENGSALEREVQGSPEPAFEDAKEDVISPAGQNGV